MKQVIEKILSPGFQISNWYSLNRVQDIPIQKGSYILWLNFLRPYAFRHKRFGDCVLETGSYIYAGSANGPGGLKARVSRHLRKEKKFHWHVDTLTTMADHVEALCFVGETECSLIFALSQAEGCSFPIEGFGSSDCQICKSHLLQLQ